MGRTRRAPVPPSQPVVPSRRVHMRLEMPQEKPNPDYAETSTPGNSVSKGDDTTRSRPDVCILEGAPDDLDRQPDIHIHAAYEAWYGWTSDEDSIRPGLQGRPHRIQATWNAVYIHGFDYSRC